MTNAKSAGSAKAKAQATVTTPEVTQLPPPRLSFLKRIAKMRSEVALRFDSTNPHFKNSYLSLNGLLAALQPALEEYGILLTQAGAVTPGGFSIQTVLQDLEPVLGPNGKPAEASMIYSEWPCVVDDNPQRIASSTTYARRYSLLSLLGMCAQDDDANLVSSNNSGGVDGLLDRL